MAKSSFPLLKSYDEEIQKIASYACNPLVLTQKTLEIAALCLADSIGCALLALNTAECLRLVGPLFPDSVVKKGSRVIGTPYVVDPITAAFNTSLMVRWLDFNDTWLAAEWGHPSDTIGALLPLADYLSQRSKNPMTIEELLLSIVKAYEIQGILSLTNSLNRVGFDHVLFVKIALTAISCKMLGGSELEVAAAVSNAFIDTGPLRTYRHTPSVGSCFCCCGLDS